MSSNYRWIALTTLLAVVNNGAIASDEGSDIGVEPAKKDSWEQTITKAKKQLDEEIAGRTAAGDLMPEQVTNPPYAVAYCEHPKPPQNVAVLELGRLKNYVCDNSDAGKKVIAWRAWYCKDKKREKLCVLGRWDTGLPSYSGELNTNVVFVSSGINVVFKRSTWRPESEFTK